MVRGRSTGILFAVPFEGQRLVRSIKSRSRIVFGRQEFSIGEIHGRETVATASGIGIANAAHAATLMILAFRPARMVLVGVAGAYAASGLEVGDIAVATEEIYGDAGVRGGNGVDPMDVIGIPLVSQSGKRYFNRFPVSAALARKALCAAQAASLGSHHIALGPIVTVAACSGSVRQASALRKKFRALCENMEGAAVAQVCTRYSVPMTEIRGISNIAGVRDKEKWDIGRAAAVSQEAALAFLS